MVVSFFFPFFYDPTVDDEHTAVEHLDLDAFFLFFFSPIRMQATAVTLRTVASSFFFRRLYSRSEARTLGGKGIFSSLFPGFLPRRWSGVRSWGFLLFFFLATPRFRRPSIGIGSLEKFPFSPFFFRRRK